VVLFVKIPLKRGVEKHLQLFQTDNLDFRDREKQIKLSISIPDKFIRGHSIVYRDSSPMDRV